jgi:hypothetical protein
MDKVRQLATSYAFIRGRHLGPFLYATFKKRFTTICHQLAFFLDPITRFLWQNDLHYIGFHCMSR